MSIDIEKALTSLVGESFSTKGLNNNIKVTSIKSLEKATPNDFAFCSLDGERGISSITNSNAGVILCNSKLEQVVDPKKEINQCLVFLDNPRLVAIQLMNLLYKKKRLVGVSSTARISKSAEIGENCYIGDFTVIGDNCRIGDDTVIYDRVSIGLNTRIGKKCIIQPGSVIGADGFAFERHHKTLELLNFPHLGGVDLGNNVEVSSNCSVARGSLSDTVIDSGTKLDALVHVAHNTKIGRDCVLAAGTIIGGSVTIGNTCWFGLNSTIKHKTKIGDQVIVGSGSSVIRDIPNKDIVAGVPAISIKHKVTSTQLFLMAALGEYNNDKSDRENGK